MKRRYNISLKDFVLLKLAMVCGSAWFIGLIITYYDIAWFFREWKWAFFALAITVGIKPWWKMMFGARSAEGLPEKKVKRKTKKKTSRKKKK